MENEMKNDKKIHDNDNDDDENVHKSLSHDSKLKLYDLLHKILKEEK
jgi:hypothetical protein